VATTQYSKGESNMKDQALDGKIKEFSDLLHSLESTENKKKLLWKEIYENAVTDRMNAYMLFTNVYTQMQSGTNEHLSLGPILSKYLERMNKSNDQLIKLAELIAKEEVESSKINPDDIFNQIGGE
jgi:hypothetical protein